MTLGEDAVELRPIAGHEHEVFLEMFGDYLAELDAYELPWDPAPPLDAYREAFDEGPEGHRRYWIIVGSACTGFLVSQVGLVWPEEDREIATIGEFYVLPTYRRQGIGRRAIEKWLTEQRGQGITYVEATVLWANTPARSFWERLGFESRSVQTVRKP
jgi:ribosomal protein S18 acetylase RimI-like enzyme